MTLRVHVATPASRAGSVTINLPDVHLGPTFSEVIFVPVPRRQRMDDLASTIYEKVSARTRRLTRNFVLRAHADEARELTISGSPYAKALRERFEGSHLHVLHLEKGQVTLTPIAGSPTLADSVRSSLVPALRAAELAAMAKQPSALLPESSSFHYLGPSGQHYRAFFRVGTALQSTVSLDAACFWISPYVSSACVVVLDSPTLMSVGLGLAQYLRDQSMTKHHEVLAVDALDETSAQAKSELAERLASIQSSIASPIHVLSVGSVLSSGTTLKLIRDAAADAGLSQSSVVLYGTGTEALPDVEQLAVAPTSLTGMDPCVLCESDKESHLIPINAQSLHMEVAGGTVRQKITLGAAARARAFLEVYGGRSVIYAHQSEEDGHFRHHAVSVDAAAMLSVPAFQEKLRIKLDSLKGNVDLIICPSHDAASAFADVAATHLGVEVIKCDEDKLIALAKDQQAVVRQSKSLLILDDVVISGDRLRGYRQFLFELGRTSGGVHVLVALARPSSEEEAEGIRNLADQMSTTETSFHPVEQVLLPNWGDEECPWCIEVEQIAGYSGMPPAGEHSQEMVERAELLSKPFKGLQTGLFWSADGNSMPLGSGSIFAPEDATEAELYFAVASAVQEMRSAGKLDDDFAPPVAKVLIPEFWTQGRFYAPAITAAILRASRPHDIMPPQPSSKLRKSVANRLSEAAGHSIQRELLLAIGLRKLPWSEAAEAGLKDDANDHVIQDFLLQRILSLPEN